MFIDDAFEQLMILLPLWLPIALVGFVIQWLIVRSAVSAALRAHARVASSDGG
jgi:hypothetical protein